MILRALEVLPQDVVAVFVGNGPQEYMADLRRQASQASLDGRVVFVDAVPHDQLPPYYTAFDVACWPQEVTMAMFEAASCSLPLVIAENGLDVRISNNNGLAFPKGDVSALVVALERLYNDRRQAKELGLRGRELVLSRFTWEGINREFERLYEG